MIDWSRVDELRAEIGAENLSEVVDLFLEEVDEVAGRLGRAPDPTRFEEDLHFLKGCAWNLGFAAFGAACQAGERLAAEGRAADVDIRAVLDSYAASRAAFLAGMRKARGAAA